MLPSGKAEFQLGQGDAPKSAGRAGARPSQAPANQSAAYWAGPTTSTALTGKAEFQLGQGDAPRFAGRAGARPSQAPV